MVVFLPERTKCRETSRAVTVGGYVCGLIYTARFQQTATGDLSKSYSHATEGQTRLPAKPRLRG